MPARYHLAYVVPAFPEGNRSMKHGKILNLGKTIEVTDLFNNESIKKIGHVAIEEIREGKEHLLAFVEELKCKGCQIILFDGENNADLETVHSVFEETKKDVLLCGSAGIASYIKNQSDQSKTYSIAERKRRYFAVCHRVKESGDGKASETI